MGTATGHIGVALFLQRLSYSTNIIKIFLRQGFLENVRKHEKGKFLFLFSALTLQHRIKRTVPC